MPPAVVAIGGSDPSCGAGVQADLRTLDAFGVTPATVVTALTVQDGRRVTRVIPVPAAIVVEQLRAASKGFPVRAVKCGMLVRPATVRALAGELAALAVPVVVDPVVRAGGGESLGGERVLRAIARHLLTHAAVVTCNVYEAQALTGIAITSIDDAERAARALAELGAAAAVVKGGHLRGDPVDVLWDGARLRRLTGPRLSRQGMHGSGCAFASAVAAGLARGRTTAVAVSDARKHVRRLIASSARTSRGGWLRRGGHAPR